MSNKHTPARKKFEAWAKTTSLKNFLFWHPSDNQYEVHAVQMAFEGYRAAAAQRGALVAQMLEALKMVLEDKAPGYHDCTDNGEPKCAWCYAAEAIAAAQGEQ